MPDAPRITRVRFTPSSAEVAAAGLLGWVRCVLDECIWLDGITLRQTVDGRFSLAFPSRRDRGGREHAIVLPLDAAIRTVVERQIIDALRAQGVAA